MIDHFANLLVDDMEKSELRQQIAQLQAELKQEQLMRFHSDATVNAAQEHIGKLQAELSEIHDQLNEYCEMELDERYPGTNGKIELARQILNSISEGKGND